MNKHDLIGTWNLQRFWFTDDAGVEVDPLGDDPVGNLLLGEDGYYAFTMMRSGRSVYQSGDLLRGTITFTITYSLFPNWVGGEQKRLASFADGELLLQTTGPILMAGKIHRGAAWWRKI